MGDADRKNLVEYNSFYSESICVIQDQKHGFAEEKELIFSDQKSIPGVMQRRNSVPGATASSRPGKLSEFGKQLREKQKAKRIYGVSEKQFRRYFQSAVRSKGITGNRLLQLMELRIDNVLYRAGFALTRPQARQFVSHRQFLVNGRRVDVPSIQVRPGDVLSVRDRFEDNPVFSDITDRSKFIPKWMQVDLQKKTITITRLPDSDELEASIAVHLIVEFYSR
jgi:small subunit ribosomal protein S4